MSARHHEEAHDVASGLVLGAASIDPSVDQVSFHPTPAPQVPCSSSPLNW